MHKFTYIGLKLLLVFSGVLFFSHLSFAQNCEDVDFKYEIKEATVTLKGESKEVVKDWFWYFGDNVGGNGQEVKHTFEKNGEYNVCLKILATSGCTGSVCKKIYIGAIVSICELKADYAFKVEGNTGVFSAKSNDVNAKYYWHVTNQAAQYNGLEVKIPFEKAGIYEVCLITVNQSETCKVLVCKKVEIGASCDWEADFIYEKDGNIIKLTAKSTTGDASKFYWSFGNGATGEGREVKYQYDKPGNYEVCLKIVSGILSNTADPTCIKAVCKKIAIGSTCDLDADFIYETVGNIVKLTAKSTVGDAAKYYWSFGNGATGEGREVKYQYDKPGDYEICLKVVSAVLSNTADLSCTKSVCKKVSVNTSSNDCKLEIDFSYKKAGLTGIFSAFSNDDDAKYYWYVSGRNVQYIGQEIMIPFDKDGSYEVCLIAVDGAEKCKLQVCKKVPVGNKIKIYPNPAADVLNVASEQIINTALIYNQTNELMISIAINQTFGSIDISNLDAGMYIISLELVDGSFISERFYKK